jgi:hypothetical protein
MRIHEQPCAGRKAGFSARLVRAFALTQGSGGDSGSVPPQFEIDYANGLASDGVVCKSNSSLRRNAKGEISRLYGHLPAVASRSRARMRRRLATRFGGIAADRLRTIRFQFLKFSDCEFTICSFFCDCRFLEPVWIFNFDRAGRLK